MTKKCMGCGAILQNNDQNKDGFIDSLDKSICERCFRLRNYGEYREVDLNNDDCLKIIKDIPKDSLVVYLTSLLNLNFDYIKNFKNVIIVLTKKDLLPKSVKDYKLINYVSSIIPDYLDIEVISSIKNYNLDNLISKIKKYSNQKEVYIIGMTNSGKSTLINKLIKNYSDNSNIEVTTSMYPSTTIDKINIQIGDLNIIDTPGLISKNGLLNYLTPKEIKKITPKKEIKPRSYQLKGSGSLLIENLIRIDYHSDNNIAIYLANNLNITKMNLSNNTLKDKYKYSFKLSDNKDIVIEDLCFIKFTKACDIDIYSLYQTNIYERDNLI